MNLAESLVQPPDLTAWKQATCFVHSEPESE